MAPLFFDSKGPGPKPVRGGVSLGMGEDRASAMDKEHSQVRITAFGDPPEATVISAGVFPGSETEEAGEVAGSWESVDIANKSDQGSGGQKADARDGAKLFENGVIDCQRLELPFDGVDTSFELSDFISHISESRPQSFGNGTLKIIDERPYGWHDPTSTGGYGDAEFSENAPGRVDPSSPVSEVFGAEPVKGCESMLIGRLNGNRLNIFVSEGFEDALGVGAVGFIANDVGSDGMRGEKDGRMAERLELAGPEMGGATGFEDDRCGLSFGEESFESGPGEPMMFANPTGVIGDGDFEYGFSEINGDSGVRVHVGLLLHESDWYSDTEKRLGTL